MPSDGYYIIWNGLLFDIIWWVISGHLDQLNGKSNEENWKEKVRHRVSVFAEWRVTLAESLVKSSRGAIAN